MNHPNVPAVRHSVNLDNISRLDEMMELCEYICRADLVPRALQGNPANVLLVVMMGRDIGLSWSQALQQIYCPPGGQPAMRGRLLLARLDEAGHDYWWEEDDGWCEFHLIHATRKREYVEKYTVQDAELAGLLWSKDGQLVSLSRDGKKMPWMTSQKMMLFWRAAGRLVSRACPGVSMGFGIIEAGPDVLPDTEVNLAAAVTPALDAARDPQDAAGPSPETVTAELADLDREHTARSEPDGERPDPETPQATAVERRALTETFTALGWDARRYRPTILEACSAYCGRAITRTADLSSDEVQAMITELRGISGPDDALPVLLADRVEVWRQRLRERDPGTADALFG